MTTNPQNKKIAVALLNWNGKSFLEKFLGTLIKNTDSTIADIWIIDNNSTDNSLVFLKDNYPNIPIVKLDKNYGFAGGYNKGLENLNYEYFLLLNSDIKVPEKWLNPLLELMESDSEIGICGPKILSYDDNKKFEYAGAAGGYIDKFAYPFCRGRVFETCENDDSQYDQTIDCFWISGAAMMIRARLFNMAGKFDEAFFAHQEEIDLCWRIQNLGYRVVCEPKSCLYHVGGGTLPKSNPFKTYLNFRNNLYLIEKNIPKYKRNRVKFVRFFLDKVAAIRMIFQGNFGEAFAVGKAYLHFWANFRKMSKQRKIIKPKAPKYLKGYYDKSIVVDYYIKGKRKFSELDVE